MFLKIFGEKQQWSCWFQLYECDFKFTLYNFFLNIQQKKVFKINYTLQNIYDLA
jgi:hypothetical protein